MNAINLSHSKLLRPIDYSHTCRSVWHRLYRTPTGSSYRHSCYCIENDSPQNTLDFRLRTCYNHAHESFVSNARLVVQPITFYKKKTMLNSDKTQLYRFKIVNDTRKEHFNEATKSQHIGSHHFANSRHGYSRIVAGAMSID